MRLTLGIVIGQRVARKSSIVRLWRWGCYPHAATLIDGGRGAPCGEATESEVDIALYMKDEGAMLDEGDG